MPVRPTFQNIRGRSWGQLAILDASVFRQARQLPVEKAEQSSEMMKNLMDKCFTVQNHGTSRRGRTETIGPKYRMNEFEGAILLGQLEGVKERFTRRNENAAYLTSKLKGFPGVVPQKLYEGTKSGSFYLYAMSYHKEHFNNADRSKFLKALNAEGISLSGYIANGLHKEPWVDHILNLKVYQKMYSPART